MLDGAPVPTTSPPLTGQHNFEVYGELLGMSEEEMRDGFANAQEDPLFDKAVEIVLETKLGSVSMLQRRLAIGYTRAGAFGSDRPLSPEVVVSIGLAICPATVTAGVIAPAPPLPS